MVLVIEIYEIKTNKYIVAYPTFGHFPFIYLTKLALHSAIGENRVPFYADLSDYRFVLKEEYSSNQN